MFENSYWIKSKKGFNEICPLFRKEFSCGKKAAKATLSITATGVYEAYLNNTRVGNFIMAPGWTSYEYRHQYQTYDVTDMIGGENEIIVSVGKGWYQSRMVAYSLYSNYGAVSSVIVQLDITYEDGSQSQITTDNTWQVAKSGILFSDIYDGEIIDARITPDNWDGAVIYHATKLTLIPQEGEPVTEHEHIKPVSMQKTPNGETVIDFGQNLTGYVSFNINAKSGERLVYSHAEILDADGNVYTGNLRSAKQMVEYTCRDGQQSYKPHHTFMGFRYIRLDEMPDGISIDNFEAIAVHSDMRRTGYFTCSNPKVNKLFSNIIWGQKDNFLDVPTDCPQRDERLGWTGDAQVFIKTASYNFDVYKFFSKWLHDLKAEQAPDGSVPHIVPNLLGRLSVNSAAWADAAVICPWQLYLTYGDKTILEEQIDSMIRWIEKVRSIGDEEYLWLGPQPFGDWLGLDSTDNTKVGSSDRELIASAYYAYSTKLLAKSLRALGRDSSEYDELYNNIVKAYRARFPEYKTQTECALSLCFDLAENKPAAAAKLADLIHAAGDALQTGFIGTPYLLDALSQNGYTELAYSLLLREEYPSWLFSVNMGATTVWEHWDSRNAEGKFWSDSMNSFNHYAYGAVASWMYETIAGINTDENAPGFEHIILRPSADDRLEYADASIDTKYGTIRSSWHRDGGRIIYEFDIPRPATLLLNGETTELAAGKHKFDIINNRRHEEHYA